jgi:hypothetical protein
LNREFYIYSFGFTNLFPKLQGHYVRSFSTLVPEVAFAENPTLFLRVRFPSRVQTLDSSITIELGVILALFICMMAFQSRFYVLMGRKQQIEKENEQEQTIRTAKHDERARRNNEVHVGDWEEKYGNGRARRSGSESAATSLGGKRKSWFGFGKSRKMTKGDSSSTSSSTDKSRSFKETANAASVDFLPRLEVEFGEPQLDSIRSSSTRPALSTLQSSSVPVAMTVKKEGWDDYLSTRQVAMSSFKSESLPARSRSSLGLISPPSSVPKSSPRFGDEVDNDDDDDTPLALSPRRPTSVFSGANRSHSSSHLDVSRRATMYEHPSTVSLPEPAALPRSQSRALSLVQQIPAVLLESPSRPALPRSDSQPGTLDNLGRRATLLDLNEPSKFNPYNERERQRTVSDERIVVGDRRRSINSLASPVKKAKEAPKIMDFEDLDAKHRKRLSL